MLKVKKILVISMLTLCLLAINGHRAYATCAKNVTLGLGGAGGIAGTTAGNGGIGSAGCGGSAASGGGGGGGGGGSAAGGAGGCGAGGGILIKNTSGTMTVSGTVDNRGCGTSTTNGGTVKLFYTGTAPSTATVNTGRLYTQSLGGGANTTPAAPTLILPANGATNVARLTNFQLRTTDADSDYLRYKIQICSDSLCNSVVQTIDQTSSQTGWSGQDTQTGTAYVGSSIITSSTIASFTLYLPNNLGTNTIYYWRGYAIDPGGSNIFSSASTIQSFATGPTSDAVMSGGMWFSNVGKKEDFDWSH